MPIRRLFLATFALLPMVVQGAQEEPPHRRSLLGKDPPELAVSDDGWINVEGELTLGKLRGRVVWLEFSYLH